MKPRAKGSAMLQRSMQAPIISRASSSVSKVVGVGAPLLKRADESLDQAVDQARRLLIHMPLVGKASDLVPVAAMREPLVLGTVQLTLEFAYPPAVVCGLNLVETARIGLVGREQNDLAGLADGNGSGILVRLGAALIGLVASAAADIVC